VTPDVLARIHAASFTTPRPWSEHELLAFTTDSSCDLIARDGGFAVIRTVVGETELLTLAVTPDQRRKGLGRMILSLALDCARIRGAEQFFLEVAADNTAAIALYQRAGFTRSGLRPRYYRSPDGHRIDALLMVLPLRASND